MEVFRIAFGKRLRLALSNADMSQTKLAQKMDVENSTVSRWVNGHDFPTNRLDEICEILGVTKEYFTNPKQVIVEDPLPAWAEKIAENLEAVKNQIFLISLPFDKSKIVKRNDNTKEVDKRVAVLEITDEELNLLTLFRILPKDKKRAAAIKFLENLVRSDKVKSRARTKSL